MAQFDDIRFFNDDEVNIALQSAVRHPMIKTLFKYTFPDLSYDQITSIVLNCHSINDFQRDVIRVCVMRVLEQSSAGLTTTGFDQLDPNQPYLYISNHRDIVLDTSLLNVTLFDHNLIRTASAIGDNLVQRPFVNALSKLTRNFIVKRGIGPRETLQSSKNLSQYIKTLIKDHQRSVWIAQRQGRTKDGNDITDKGVLKMIGLAADDQPIHEYFNSINIVPVSISYEYDPTDILKVPELLAQAADQEYIKSENEDFNSILKGALGQKSHIHITAGQPLRFTNDSCLSTNQMLQHIVSTLNDTIQYNYKLWPTNYVAHDMLTQSDKYSMYYTQKDRAYFERRLRLRVDVKDTNSLDQFLMMYAQPVLNKEQLTVLDDA